MIRLPVALLFVVVLCSESLLLCKMVVLLCACCVFVFYVCFEFRFVGPA